MKHSTRQYPTVSNRGKLPASLLEKIQGAQGASFELDGWSCRASAYADGVVYRVKFQKGINEDVTEEFSVEVDDSGGILEIRYEQEGDHVTIDNQGGVFQGYEGRKSMRFPQKLSALYSQAGELTAMEETGLRKPNTYFDIDLSPTGFQEGHKTTGSYLYVHLGVSDTGILDARGYSAGGLVEENFHIVFQSALQGINHQREGGIMVQSEKKIPIVIRYGGRSVEVSIQGIVIGRYEIEDVIPDSIAQILGIQPPKSMLIQASGIVVMTGERIEEIKPSK